MNTLVYLTAADFGLDGDSLICRKSNGLLLVLFYSTNCQYCGPARNAFNTVASQFIQGSCKFGMINVTQNPRVPEIARACKTPIKFVPFLLAFFNGRPIAIYQSAYQPQNLGQFVQACYASIKDRVDAFGRVKKEEEIPAYTTGIPICEDGVCYINYDDAYGRA